MNKDRQALLHLFLISGIGFAAVHKICRGLLRQIDPNAYIEDAFRDLGLLCKLPFSSLYSYSIESLQKTFVISSKLAQRIYDGLQDYGLIDQEIMLANKHGIDIYTIFDDQYPSVLRNIYMPPLVLYVQGELPNDEKKLIAFVGARRIDNYGAQAVRHLVPTMVKQGWYIVSGGAFGADTLAHESTLQENGRTLVVLGSGLLSLYPAENKNLFSTIVQQGGALISSFPLLATPVRKNFPARNRIISGLSRGTVVVRASRRSGALITARFALEQGRQVFAVPGNIFDDLSQGCNYLLTQGAFPVSSAADILEEFGEQINLSCSHVVSCQRSKSRDELHPIMQHLVAASSFDELIEKTGLSFEKLQDSLFELQLVGKVKQNFAGFWEKIDG